MSCPPFSIATTSQLFLPHQLHHVVVHDMEGALKPPKTRSVHNNPMSHVREEPAKKIGRHFWSPIPLLLFPLRRKPKMTSLMFWGKFIISLFFPRFSCHFFGLLAGDSSFKRSPWDSTKERSSLIATIGSTTKLLAGKSQT